MASHKRSAQAKQKARFEAHLDSADFGGIFAAEERRCQQDAQKKEAALRYKACERKNRYATQQEALAAISACEDHGARGLHCYQCQYCKGWHLTSKPHHNV